MASTEELNGLLVLGKIRNSVARITREDDRRTASLLHAAFRPDGATDFSVSSRSSDGLSRLGRSWFTGHARDPAWRNRLRQGGLGMRSALPASQRGTFYPTLTSPVR